MIYAYLLFAKKRMIFVASKEWPLYLDFAMNEGPFSFERSSYSPIRRIYLKCALLWNEEGNLKHLVDIFFLFVY